MADFFESLIGLIKTLVSFIYNFISSLVILISQIPTYINYVIGIINNVIPTQLLAFVVLCITIVVVLFIINRK